MYQHLSLHDIQLVLNCVIHTGMDILVQHDHAVSKFTTTLVLALGTQLLKAFDGNGLC